MSPREVLQRAIDVVTSGRAGYGTPEINHARTAVLWATYLGADVSPYDVCMLNILQKVSRAIADPEEIDHLVDIAGYAANAAVSQDVSEANASVYQTLLNAEEVGKLRKLSESLEEE